MLLQNKKYYTFEILNNVTLDDVLCKKVTCPLIRRKEGSVYVKLRSKMYLATSDELVLFDLFDH